MSTLPMTPSPMLRLSVEVQEMIWEAALPQPRTVEVRFGVLEWVVDGDKASWQPAPEMTATIAAESHIFLEPSLTTSLGNPSSSTPGKRIFKYGIYKCGSWPKSNLDSLLHVCYLSRKVVLRHYSLFFDHNLSPNFLFSSTKDTLFFNNQDVMNLALNHRDGRALKDCVLAGLAKVHQLATKYWGGVPYVKSCPTLQILTLVSGIHAPDDSGLDFLPPLHTSIDRAIVHYSSDITKISHYLWNKNQEKLKSRLEWQVNEARDEMEGMLEMKGNTALHFEIRLGWLVGKEARSKLEGHREAYEKKYLQWVATQGETQRGTTKGDEKASEMEPES